MEQLIFVAATLKAAFIIRGHGDNHTDEQIVALAVSLINAAKAATEPPTTPPILPTQEGGT